MISEIDVEALRQTRIEVKNLRIERLAEGDLCHIKIGLCRDGKDTEYEVIESGFEWKTQHQFYLSSVYEELDLTRLKYHHPEEISPYAFKYATFETQDVFVVHIKQPKLAGAFWFFKDESLSSFDVWVSGKVCHKEIILTPGEDLWFNTDENPYLTPLMLLRKPSLYWRRLGEKLKELMLTPEDVDQV